MSVAPGHAGLVASSNPRIYIRPELHAELNHLDLTGKISISDSRVVGSGSFGDISKSQCTLSDGKVITVAVKRLRFYLKEDVDLIFEKEVYVWSKLNHINVLSLVGFAFEEPSGYPLLMSEWMTNGSSLNYVKSNSDCDLMRLVTGIAEGLAYLHNQNIVHSDIKPDNIIVTEDGDPRICDFGGSRIAVASKSVAKPSSGIRGTLRYLAYELVALSDRHSSHTKESDVWAFGMTVFALVAKEHPYSLLGEAQVPKAIMNREVPSFNFWTSLSSEEKRIFRNICFLCWDHEPKRRAAMSFIVTNLRDFRPQKLISRSLCEPGSSEPDVKRRKVSSFAALQTSDSLELVHGTKVDRIDPLICIFSSLERFFSFIDSRSEVYQYLNTVWKVFLSLHSLITEDFQLDGKLEHLMRAMGEVMEAVVASSSVNESQNQKQVIIRLLQQATECCLFIRQYSQKSYNERVLDMGSAWKMAELTSFFVTFKEALETGTGSLPVFSSTRTSRPIDDSMLRQRLSPSETDANDQRLCLLGTRVEVQEQIMEWALSATGQNIFWLHGVAGSGKSTVIASVAEHFRGIYRLGALLRFKRGTSDPSSIIRTIAFRLASFDSTIGSLILAETERDKDIANASLATQFDKLLFEPLVAAAGAQIGPVFVVLDALDECGVPTTRKRVMQILLGGIRRLPSNFKFLISSRLEHDIDRAFRSLQSDSVVTVLELDYTSQLSHRDVQSYLSYEIRSIVEYEDIPDNGWLEKQLATIGETAAGLFVWASTIVKLVSEHDSPVEKITELASNVRSLSGLDQLYSTVLIHSGISWHDVKSKTRFQRVIGLILLNKTPLIESTIDAILGLTAGECRTTLSRLRSVIDYRPGEPIRLFHTSFSDYLMSSTPSEDWFVDIYAQNSFIAMRSFDIMRDELRFNICNIRSSYIRNVDDIGLEDRIEKHISPHAAYACIFWSQHLCEVPCEPAMIQGLSKFLYNQLLYWLEVISLLNKVSMVGPELFAVIKWIGNYDLEIAGFLRDARRLINIFAIPISQSVPHIYLSMLSLSGDESKVSAHYLRYTSSLAHITRRGVKRQSSLLKLLEGHTDHVTSVGFSPDGSLIASGSDDKTVRIWDSEKGEPAAGPFDGRVGRVTSVEFSLDGTFIVVGGWGGTISVLDVKSGGIIVGPIGDILATSVAFSPDGKHIASGSDNLVKIWDLESAITVGSLLFGHGDEVACVAYSRDGRFIVSGSYDKSVRVWEVESRRLIREPLLGHTAKVNSVAFSPDGRHVVSSSNDKTIRIWDLEKGEVDYSPLTGHNREVLSVAYSSDGTRIVSGSADKTVRVWNSRGKLVVGPFIHANTVNSVMFSPDGTRVLSGSDDKTIRIWDTESGKIDSGPAPERVHRVSGVRFSPDGACIISNNGIIWCIEDGAIVSKGVDEKKLGTLSISDGMEFGPSTEDSIIKWDLYTGNVLSSENDSLESYPNCIAVSPNGKRFAFGSSGLIRIWDKEHDKLVCRPFSGQGRCIWSLTFSPDTKHIASGSDMCIWVYDAETGALVSGPFTGHTSDIYSIAYSPNGRQFATGSGDRTIRVWDVETGNSRIFDEHKHSVMSVSFSPNGSQLVSSARDNEIRVWNVQTEASDVCLSKWILGEDGWIRDIHGELLLWVPHDIRPFLKHFHPSNIATLNCKPFASLDFLGSAQGEQWQECYHPLE